MTNTLGIYNKIMIKADTNGYFSLTDMWKAQGSDPSRRPVRWLNQKDTLKLLETINDSNQSTSEVLWKIQRGGAMPGTWALQKVAIAYAEYLSPQFHAWVLDSVTTFVAMEEDPEAGISRYSKKCINALKKEGRSDTFIMERLEGIALRNLMDSEACVASVYSERVFIKGTCRSAP